MDLFKIMIICYLFALLICLLCCLFFVIEEHRFEKEIESEFMDD